MRIFNRGILMWFLLFAPFANATSGCFKSRVINPLPFTGEVGEKFELDNNSKWIVTREAKRSIRAYRPRVTICPSFKKMLISKDYSELNWCTISSPNADNLNVGVKFDGIRKPSRTPFLSKERDFRKEEELRRQQVLRPDPLLNF